ncbi:sugar nucleotide-binding protein [Algibacter mikhailovii]|uniref:RmlD-like substrate binding domain-containing protein n=1 Tax=Algibacter mikhailovii TaxID=425498 RepID=A0A918RC96_9FLAO|nr:sugar nucleotide-binding protein [Algibacter mikhailovii]GGZ93637.1 hypothetical protein GCM10007028_35070 [Algibacter mikhailovii]
MTNLLITGLKDQCGSKIKALASNYAQYNFIFMEVDTLDIRNHQSEADFIALNNINVIISCPAQTNVDKAETH